jgi:hypothetical protein
MFQEEVMSFWHKISHWLKTNSEFIDTYTRDGLCYTGFRCNDCGVVREEQYNPTMQYLLEFQARHSEISSEWKSPFEGAEPLLRPPDRAFIERLKASDIDREFIARVEAKRAAWEIATKFNK